MFRSDQKAVQSALAHKRLEVLQKDLDCMVTDLNSLTSICSFMAGFTFIVFQFPAAPHEGRWELGLMYFGVTVSLSCNIFVIVTGKLVSMLGPRMSLRGPAGSVEKVDALMRTYVRGTYRVFVLGLVAFLIMIAMLLILSIPESMIGVTIGCIMTLVVCGGTVFYYLRRIGNEFKYKEPKLLDSALINSLNYDNNIDQNDLNVADAVRLVGSTQNSSSLRRTSSTGNAVQSGTGTYLKASEFLGISSDSNTVKL